MTVVANLIAAGLAAASVALGYFAWRRRLDVSRGDTTMRGLGAALLLLLAATFTGYAPLEWAGIYLFLTALAVALIAAVVWEVTGYRERRAVRALAVAMGGPVDRRSFRRQPRSPMVIMLLYIVGLLCLELVFLGGILLFKVPESWWAAPFVDLTLVLGGGGPSRPLPRLMAPLVIGAVVAVIHTMVNTFRRA